MAIEIFFGTNRKVKKWNQSQEPIDFGTELNQSKPLLHFSKASVSYEDGSIEKINTPKNLFPDQLCCNQDIFSEIQDRIYKGIDTILFFHGFRTTFKDSLVEAAELKRLYEKESGREYTVIVFSWPSDGKLFSYKSDKKDAAASSKVFGTGIYQLSLFIMELCRIKFSRKTVSDTGESIDSKEDEKLNCGRLHIIAYSMGNYVLRCALQKLNKITKNAILRLFDEVLLIAADEDKDAMGHKYKLKSLPKFSRRVSIYFNQEDIPLIMSDLFASNKSRLGSKGPYQPHNIPFNTDLIDCRNVVSGLLEHDYHKTEPAVVRDISYVLAGWKSEKIPGRVYFPETNSYHLITPETVKQVDVSDDLRGP